MDQGGRDLIKTVYETLAYFTAHQQPVWKFDIKDPNSALGE